MLGPAHMRVRDLPVPIQPGDVPGVKEAKWSASAKPEWVCLSFEPFVFDAAYTGEELCSSSEVWQQGACLWCTGLLGRLERICQVRVVIIWHVVVFGAHVCSASGASGAVG
jgi:hypothetical protein